MSNNYWDNYSLNSGGVRKVEGTGYSYFQHQRYVKETIKQMIEKGLKNTQAYKFYPSSRDYSQIYVTISFPYENIEWPAVVVGALPGGNIGPDFQHFVRDLYDGMGNIIGERYGGLIESNLTVTVCSKSTPERDELADVVHYILMQGIYRGLESQGITFPNDAIRIESEREEDFGSDHIYAIEIGIKLYSQWYSDYYYEHITDIRVDTPTTPGGPNPPAIPEIPIDIVIYPDQPNAPPRPISERMANFLGQLPCCGECGLRILPKPNTGPNPESRFYQEAIGAELCGCDNKQIII